MLTHNKLEWDSRFFGFSVDKAELKNCTDAELNNYFTYCLLNSIKLSYLFVDNNDKISLGQLSAFANNLEDTKVCYSRKIENDEKITVAENIIEFSGNYPSNDLISLSLRSGSYSRFYLDKRFAPGKFEELYTEWITKSVQKLVADKVYIYVENNELLGFITVYRKQNISWIGLVAVAEKSIGKGIGSKLSQVAIRFAIDQNCNYLKVYTQAQNTPACGLYEKCGFRVEEKTDIYHIWHKVYEVY
jgi:dTDP-4-amino-4,6-dideoxy-D-galactose acyltransferase